MLYDIDCSIGVYKQQILYNAWLGLTFETLSDQNAAYSYYAKDTIDKHSYTRQMLKISWGRA